MKFQYIEHAVSPLHDSCRKTREAKRSGGAEPKRSGNRTGRGRCENGLRPARKVWMGSLRRAAPGHLWVPFRRARARSRIGGATCSDLTCPDKKSCKCCNIDFANLARFREFRTTSRILLKRRKFCKQTSRCESRTPGFGAGGACSVDAFGIPSGLPSGTCKRLQGAHCAFTRNQSC